MTHAITETRKPLALTRGFTLIEIMIAVLILGILAAIAITSYQNTVIRSNRTEATILLSQTAQALERCYTQFTAYNDANCAVLGRIPIASEGGWYIIEDDDEVAAAGFTLTAVAQGRQANLDDECANFTLNHRGQRGVTGTGNAADCW